MRIVVISTCQGVDRYVVGQVLRVWPDTPVLRPTWTAPRPGPPAAVRLLIGAPVRTLRRLALARIRRREAGTAARLLPGGAASGALRPVGLPADELNTAPTVARLAALAPDVLVLSGCPVLHDAVLRVPSVGTLNVHFGVPPAYRGEDTLLHALRRRDYDHLGVTVHGVDAGIDTGPIVAQAFPALEPTDTLASLVAKGARLAADLLVEALGEVERSGAVPGVPQSAGGRLYRRGDRRLWHGAAVVLDRTVLRRRPPARGPRIVRSYEPGGSAAIRVKPPTGVVGARVAYDSRDG